MSQVQVSALIADDERLGRACLIDVINKRPGWQVCSELENGLEFIKTANLPAFDVAFLDIKMPGLDGIEVAKKLSSSSSLIIFVTAYEQYALSAFGVDAFGFLLKPFSDDDFDHVAERVESQLVICQQASHTGHSAQFIELKYNGGAELVQTNQIVWAQADHNYVRVHTTAGVYVVRSSISSLFAELSEPSLARVHRSAILNVRRIASLMSIGASRWQAVMDDGSRVPVSAAQLGPLKHKLLQYRRSCD